MIKMLFLWAGLGVAAAATQSAKPVTVAPTPQPAYFFTIALDPFYQFTSTGSLTAEDAAQANCYHFIYDQDGKLAKIEFRRAGKLMPDPLLGVAQIDFEMKPGLERRWFRDEQGQSIRDVDGVQGEELTLNAAGYPTDITNLDASGGKTRDNNGVIHYVRTLDNLNRVVALRRIGLLGTAITDDYGFFETRTAYDLHGRAMERGNYDSSGNLLNNNDGVAITRTTTTINPDSTQIIESYFDSSGLAVEEKSTGVHQCERTLDKRGFLLDESYFDATGSPTLTAEDGIHERRYTYDDRGNELTEEFFDPNGKPVNRRNAEQRDTGFAKVIYKYDEANRVMQKAYFGDDGAPEILPDLGAAMIRQQYDEKGNIVSRQFLDGQGHPSPNVRFGVPAIRLEVKGDTTYVSLRNEKDQPAKNPVNGYYAFSYKNGDTPLSPTNTYYDRYGRELSYFPRVSVINPHLNALRGNRAMKWSARLGAGAAGLGSLLACFLAMRKSSHTKRRKVYVPSPVERFLGWFAVLAILEGTLRFFMTVYWAWVGYQNGKMGNGFYVLEALFMLFFLYRLYRLTLTMRVLNIAREDLDRLVRAFFAKAELKPEWIESRNRYVTPPLDVRINFFTGKNHAYLAFISRGRKGHELALGAAQYIRAQSGNNQSPPRTQAIAFYYPCVAFAYFLLACTAFYTLYQLIKGF